MITTYILGLREASKQGLDFIGTSSGIQFDSSTSVAHYRSWHSWPNSGDFIGGPHRGSSLTHRHPWLDITQVHGCDLTETLHRGRFGLWNHQSADPAVSVFWHDDWWFASESEDSASSWGDCGSSSIWWFLQPGHNTTTSQCGTPLYIE